MESKEAMSLLKQVCAQYTGTLNEHQALQQALGIVADGLYTEKLKKEEDKETEESPSDS